MRTFFLHGVLTAASLIIFAWSSNAQERKHENPITIPQPGNIQIATISDGSILIGRITEITGDTIVFVTQHGTLSIPSGHILKLSLIHI